MSSAFFIGIFLFFVGPSQILGFNESLTMLIVGLFLTANFLAPLAIPVLPEMIQATQAKYPGCKSETAGNYTGALLNTFLGLGQVLGPMFGATLYASVGFRLTQDIMALICIVFSVLYFFLAEGRSAFRDTLMGR